MHLFYKIIIICLKIEVGMNIGTGVRPVLAEYFLASALLRHVLLMI